MSCCVFAESELENTVRWSNERCYSNRLTCCSSSIANDFECCLHLVGIFPQLEFQLEVDWENDCRSVHRCHLNFPSQIDVCSVWSQESGLRTVENSFFFVTWRSEIFLLWKLFIHFFYFLRGCDQQLEISTLPSSLMTTDIQFLCIAIFHEGYNQAFEITIIIKQANCR